MVKHEHERGKLSLSVNPPTEYLNSSLSDRYHNNVTRCVVRLYVCRVLYHEGDPQCFYSKLSYLDFIHAAVVIIIFFGREKDWKFSSGE